MEDIKITPVSIKGNPKKSSIIDIFISEPPANKEFLAGRLFVLSEVGKDKKNAEAISAFLIDRLNYFYYENDKILLREKLTSLKPEHIFETALSKTNKAFAEFLRTQKINFELENLNITVGLLYQREIHFSLCGKNKVFLVYRQPSQNGHEAEYKLADLSKQSERAEKNIFSNILSGSCPEQGGIFICNEAMSEYLSAGQITKIISTLPPASISEQIKNLLEKINHFIAFGGIIIKESRKITPSKERLEIKSPIINYDSIQRLNSTEDNTEKLLSPSGIFSIKNILQKLFKGQKSASVNTISLKDDIYSQKRFFGFSKKFLREFLTFLSYPINFFYFIAKSLPRLNFFNPDKIKTLIAPLLRINFSFGYFKNFDRKKIFLLSAILLVSLLLFISINRNRSKQAEQAEIKNYETLVDEIEKMQNQVEANLLYSNDEGAAKLFNDINEKISTLPQETDEQIEKYNTFKDTFQEQMNKIRRITLIENPPLVADFSKIETTAKTDSLLFFEELLYSSDTDNKSIYITDTKDNTVTTLTDLKGDINTLSSPTINGKSIFYLNQDRITELVTTEKTLKSLSFTGGTSIQGASAIGTYNDRLYILVKNSNQILRFNRQGDQFGSPYAWVTDQADFSKAVDMFIDGNIFVLNDDGSILKFLRGSLDEFSLEKIEPPLEVPTKISGSVENNYLYLLEPKNNRLIVYDKKGQFLAQYQSPSFDSLTDFSVDETNKLVYILNDSKLYKFEAGFLQ